MSLSTIRSLLKALQRKVEELGERNRKPVRFDEVGLGDPDPPVHDGPHFIVHVPVTLPPDYERTFFRYPNRD